MSSDAKEIRLCVVMINFRTPKFVIDSLATLLPELEPAEACVVVVDNHSEDDSPQQINSWLAGHDHEAMVTFIQSPTNGGFSAGNNIGIKTLDAEYYLLLNSDTLVRSGAIQQLLHTMDDHPEAGLLSPRLEWPDGKGQQSCFRYTTPFSELMSAAQTGLIDRVLRRYVVAMPLQSKLVSSEWTSFACVLIRRKVFQQVGLMDEGYFMYFEDAEFCSRAHKAGWKTLHQPAAHIVHLRGGSSPVKKNSIAKKRLPKYFYASRTRFFYQTGGRLWLTAANLMWWLGRVVSKPRQLLGRSDKLAIERQWLDIWTNWMTPLKNPRHPDS